MQVPSLGQKVFRAFLLTFLAVFLTGLLDPLKDLANALVTGQPVDFKATAALVLGIVVGAIAAAIRVIIALLPVFKDDNAYGIARR